MKLEIQNKKISTLVRKGNAKLPFPEKLLNRLRQLERAPNARSVARIAKCHRLQKEARFAFDDMMALNVTANWRLCFRIKPPKVIIMDYCDYH